MFITTLLFFINKFIAFFIFYLYTNIIGFSVLLLAVIGSTFAWFSIRTNNEINAKTELTTANLGLITFANGNTATVSGSEIYPGWENQPISFTITGSNITEATKYRIIATVTGSLALGSVLEYSMQCVTINNGTCADIITTAPLSTTIYEGILATGNDTHTYTVNMRFPETDENQNIYQGKNYSVSFSVFIEKNDKLTYDSSNDSTKVYSTESTCFTTTEGEYGITITGYNDSLAECGSEVSIPNVINGKNVIAIGAEAFKNKILPE